MTRTPSTMLGLGTTAPDFLLPDTTAGGKEVGLSDFEAAPALLVVFLCNHCPFVQHVAGELAALSRDLPARGAAMVGISSNDVAAYPADGPEAMADGGRPPGLGLPLPLRRDPDGRRRLPGRLHPRLLPLRRRPEVRLPGPARRQPPRQRPPRHRRRPPGRRRRRPRRPAPSPKTSAPASAATSSGSRATSRSGADQHGRDSTFTPQRPEAQHVAAGMRNRPMGATCCAGGHRTGATPGYAGAFEVRRRRRPPGARR